jgi:UDP-3-O-[3-hydroxymyristoyl] glucosamine N-acyltransferase
VVTLTLDELADKLDVEYDGDGSIALNGVAEIASAQKGDLSFVANPKYIAKLSESNASVVIVHKDLETDFRPVIWSSNPYLTFTKAIYIFHKDKRDTSTGIHPTAHVSSNVQIGKDVSIMAHVIIEDDVVIGDNSILYPGTYVGKGCTIGDEVTIYPHVSLYSKCKVGDRVIIHSGSRIGPSGVQSENIFSVILESDVELGANVVVSGIPQNPTCISIGTKIDNLVQIGSGTNIGPHCIIVAQVTIGENVVFKNHVTIAGQVVISPNITIGAFSQIGAKSVVVDDVPDKAAYWGVPAQPHTKEKRLKANLARLPKIFSRIQALEDYLSKSE